MSHSSQSLEASAVAHARQLGQSGQSIEYRDYLVSAEPGVSFHVAAGSIVWKEMRKAAEEELRSSAPEASPVTEYLSYSVYPYKGGVRDYGLTLHFQKGKSPEAVMAEVSKVLKDLYEEWLSAPFRFRRMSFQLIGPGGESYSGKVR